jgi:hypothetical protein
MIASTLIFIKASTLIPIEALSYGFCRSIITLSLGGRGQGVSHLLGLSVTTKNRRLFQIKKNPTKIGGVFLEFLIL